MILAAMTHFFAGHWSFVTALRLVFTYAAVLFGITHTILRQYKDTSSTAIQLSESPTGNAEHNLTDPALAVTTNHQYAWAVTRANLQSLVITATGPVTIKTNSSGSPTDTLTLTATTPYIVWTLATDLIAKCPFTADVTTIYVTNAGSGSVVFQIRALTND